MAFSSFEADLVIRRFAEAAVRPASPRAEVTPLERFTLAPAQRERPRPAERRPEPGSEPRVTLERRAPERRAAEARQAETRPDRPAGPGPTAKTDTADRPSSRPATAAERPEARAERAASAEPPVETNVADRAVSRPAVADGRPASAVAPGGLNAFSHGSAGATAAPSLPQEAIPTDLAALVAAEAAPAAETKDLEEIEVTEEEGYDAPAGQALPLIPMPTTVVAPVAGRRGGVEGDAPDEQSSAPRAVTTGSGGTELAGALPGLPAENGATDFAAILAPQDSDAAHPGLLSVQGGAGAAAPASSASGTSPGQAQQPAAPPVPLGAVPMTIGLRALAGSSRFEIRLDPVDLGRIDVSLDINKDQGTVTAHLLVERPETLALLQRDAGSLQQALSQAGLDPSEGGINLSLRGESGSGGQGADGRKPESREGGPRLADGSELRDPADPAPLRLLRSLSGIDIRI